MAAVPFNNTYDLESWASSIIDVRLAYENKYKKCVSFIENEIISKIVIKENLIETKQASQTFEFNWAQKELSNLTEEQIKQIENQLRVDFSDIIGLSTTIVLQHTSSYIYQITLTFSLTQSSFESAPRSAIEKWVADIYTERLKFQQESLQKVADAVDNIKQRVMGAPVIKEQLAKTLSAEFTVSLNFTSPLTGYDRGQIDLIHKKLGEEFSKINFLQTSITLKFDNKESKKPFTDMKFSFKLLKESIPSAASSVVPSAGVSAVKSQEEVFIHRLNLIIASILNLCVCPITKNRLVRPVLALTGETYSEDSLENLLEANPNNPLNHARDQSIVVNRVVKDILDGVIVLQEQLVKGGLQKILSSAREIIKRAECPVSLQLLSYPQIVMPSGNTYNAPELINLLKNSHKDPITSQNITYTTPNLLMEKIIPEIENLQNLVDEFYP